jgi:poly(3-hydroxybutyrate) depolymerase
MKSFFVRAAMVALFAFRAIGCRAAPPATNAANTKGSERLGREELLACLGAPPEALYEPERLAAPPAPGLSVHTFDQQTSNCGPVARRYLSYVPKRLGARTAAPVVLVLHGRGASAEAMMGFQTRGTFNALADEKAFIVVYGNGLPTSFNIPGLSNSGHWRSEYTELGATVDELEYLQRIVQDLADRAVIAGGNDVFLVGQSGGGGMALSAARQRPNAYAGVAAFMPYVGFSATATENLAGTRLRRVLFAYSAIDPALPPNYSTQVLAPLAKAWARALGVPDSDIESPTVTPLPDVVKEGEGRTADGEVEQATRDSRVKRFDLHSANGALCQLVFDRAGHFWPTHEYADPAPILRQFGLRNQDIEGAEETWRCLGE